MLRRVAGGVHRFTSDPLSQPVSCWSRPRDATTHSRETHEHRNRLGQSHRSLRV